MNSKMIDKSMQLLVHNTLVNYKLITPYEKIHITPHHTIIIAGEYATHYIISCEKTHRKFFMKRVKGVDGMLLCHPYLEKYFYQGSSYTFPHIVVPPFEVAQNHYYILDFIEGLTLDDLPENSSHDFWENIAIQLCDQIDDLATIHAPQYSNQGKFVTSTYAEILKNRFKYRMQHPFISTLPYKKIEIAVEHCFEILDRSQYSAPCLLHMDVKPANIVFNPDTNRISLIDFESARFGDLDFWWIQLYLSQWNYFNRPYCEIIAPLIIRGKIDIDKVLENEKLRCYLFYQTLCNQIYYYNLNISCPVKMDSLFHSLMEDFSRRYE